MKPVAKKKPVLKINKKTRRADWLKDRAEREALRAMLGEMIWTELCKLGFWDENPSSEARSKYIDGLSLPDVKKMVADVTRLIRSLKEIGEKGKGRSKRKTTDKIPHGFALWLQPNLAARLGNLSCNMFGSQVCAQAGFTVAKGERILKALERRS